MTNAFQNLLTIDFWFGSPKIWSLELKIYFAFFLALAIASVICYIIFTKKAKDYKPFASIKNLTFGWLLGFALIGLLFDFFIWQNIPYLSSRIFIILIFLAIVIWGVSLAIFIQGSWQKQILDFEAEKEYQKYLPKKKRKK